MFNKKELDNIRKELPEKAKIMGVTKTKPVGDIIKAVNSGIKIIGENYIQEAEPKYEKLRGLFKENKVSFHLIGHLQSNKAKKAVEIFNCIETIDSLKLAEKINNVCENLNKKIDIMIEINFNENLKSGIRISKINYLINMVKKLQNLNLIGFMCIPPINKEKECFGKMKELKEEYKVRELSMGMSSDYKIAIENGATIIRLGRILFGERD